jgi:hypothetical protein
MYTILFYQVRQRRSLWRIAEYIRVQASNWIYSISTGAIVGGGKIPGLESLEILLQYV